jgi:hypothetical protein
MAPWKHGLGKGRGRGKNFYYALAEEAASKENHGNCYAKKLMDEAPKHGLSQMEIASLNGNLFGAGSDTSSSTLITFVLACCAFPEVLPKAWEELDRVVGSYRSPGLDDDLPYIRAFVKEVFRWRSVAIIGGQPHANIQDDWYNVSLELLQLTYMLEDKSLILEQYRAGIFPRTPGYKATCGRSTAIRTISQSQIDSLRNGLSKAIHYTDPSPTRRDT